MPLFEFACDDCGHRFEHLVRGGERPSACPRCEAATPRKLFSAFAKPREGGSLPSFAGPACGTCGDPRGPGSCSLDN